MDAGWRSRLTVGGRAPGEVARFGNGRAAGEHRVQAEPPTALCSLLGGRRQQAAVHHPRKRRDARAAIRRFELVKS
jgi:hypothetical protein